MSNGMKLALVVGTLEGFRDYLFEQKGSVLSPNRFVKNDTVYQYAGNVRQVLGYHFDKAVFLHSASKLVDIEQIKINVEMQLCSGRHGV